MSERPTPETDKIITDWMQGVTKELPNFVDIARKLERERDELLAYLDAAHYATCNAELRKGRDEARDELCHLRACVFDVMSALDAGAFTELRKAWEEGAK